MRAKKVFKNTIWGFIYQGVALICGLILPRLILTSFGSKYNGVTGAITQFLQVISLFQAGIGGVTTAALYKPLAENDVTKVSIIIKSTESFLRKVVLIFIIFAVIVACGYPFLVSNDFDWFFTASLVMIMSLSTFAQYFFGQTYMFLLNADQNQRLVSIVNSVKIIANTAISAVIINMGFGIREVKLGSAVVFVLAPLFISFYAKKKYKIISNVQRDNSVIKQRWNNFAQQVAAFVTNNTDLVVLSFFSTVYEVSVYTVYILVLNGVFGIFLPLTKGVEAAFGNMLAREEHNLVNKNMRIYEQVVFAASTFLFTVTIIMALPFITIYTAKVTDVNYFRPIFLYIMIVAIMFKCFRLPYEGIANAAGHFRQTRNPAFWEAGINIAVSVALVFKFGIVGVAIGTLCAYIFRTIRYAIYTSRNIVRRSLRLFAKRILLSAVCLFATMGISYVIPLPKATSFYTWIPNAVVISIVTFIIVATVEIIFYRNDLKELLKMAKGILRKRTAKNTQKITNDINETVSGIAKDTIPEITGISENNGTGESRSVTNKKVDKYMFGIGKIK